MRRLLLNRKWRLQIFRPMYRPSPWNPSCVDAIGERESKMKKTKATTKSGQETNAAGRKLMAALAELKEARRTGDYSGMVIRHVQIRGK